MDQIPLTYNNEKKQKVTILSKFYQKVIYSLDFAIFPRLEWSDRYFDLMQQSQKQLPRKLILAGQTSFIRTKVSGMVLKNT